MAGCYECLGAGDCQACDGSGVENGSRCRLCRGGGRCPICDGTGALPEPVSEPPRSAPAADVRLDRDAFDAVVRRWFFADELSSTTMDRLFREWNAFASDPARVLGQAARFEPRNQSVDGWAWWEERQRGDHCLVLPITWEERLAMLLSDDPTVAGPLPRPYCPERLWGHWQLDGRGKTLFDVVPTDDDEGWEFRPDGTVDGWGARDRRGWWWRVRRGHFDRILLGRTDQPRRIRESWSLLRHKGETIDLGPPGSDGPFYRYRRPGASTEPVSPR